MNSAADSLARMNDLFAAAEHTGSLGALMFRALVLVLLLVAVAWFLRFLQQKRGLGGPTSRRPMEVLSALPLGQRRQAVLLRVSGRLLLLGMGEGGVRLLGRFQGEEAEDLLRATGRDPGSFRLHLDAAARKGGEDA